MKVALVGGGYWGAKLLRNLLAILGPEGVVLADSDPERLAAARTVAPGLETCRSLEEALSDREVTAVVLATPMSTHAELAEATLTAGRDVLVEKPLAHSVAAAQRLVDLADQYGRILMAGHTFLFSPRVEWIADYLHRDTHNSIHYVTSSRLNLGIHRDDANVIWDLAPHDFSIVFHLLGEFPVTVSTSVRSIVKPSHPDVAFMNLTFPSGVLAEIAVSWLAARKIRQLNIVADSGMVVFDDIDPDEPVKIHDRGVVVDDSADYGHNRLTYRYGDTLSPHISVEEPLERQLRHFLSCVRTRNDPRSDGRFGLQIVAALAAADQSWRRGGMPVSIQPEADALAPVD